MCDYSLHHVASRPAKLEDKLVTAKFRDSITHGFAAVSEPHVAVCLLPGTELAFEEHVRCRPLFDISILPGKKIGQRLARFRQINVHNAVTHHDALEFPDGQVVLLTRLRAGQRATVLQLPVVMTPQSTREVEVARPTVRDPSVSTWAASADPEKALPISLWAESDTAHDHDNDIEPATAIATESGCGLNEPAVREL